MTCARGSLKSAVVLAVLAAAGPVAAAGPARAAAYDPSSLCASATPDRSQVVGALRAMRAASNQQARVAGGLSLVARSNWVSLPDPDPVVIGGLSVRRSVVAADAESPVPAPPRPPLPHSDWTFRYDGVAGRTRYDDVTYYYDHVYRWHEMRDRFPGNEYDGYEPQDGPEPAAALRVLGTPRAWIAAPAPADDVTPVGLVDGGLAKTWVGEFPGWPSDPPGLVYGCSVSGATLRLTKQDGVDGEPTVATVTFTESGALATVDIVSPEPSVLPAQESYSYGPTTVDPPRPVVLAEAWRTAVVLGTFQDLERGSLRAGTSAVLTKPTQSARVRMLRAVVAARVARYDTAPVTRTPVPDGVVVRVSRPDLPSRSWTFALTVSGRRVTLSDNF